MKAKSKALGERLSSEYDRWERYYRDGGSDPFWSDGANMWLIRNHILYYRRQIEEELSPDEYPEAYFREVPPEVDPNYMAKPDEIRKAAKETYSAIINSREYTWIMHNLGYERLSKRVRERAQNQVQYIAGIKAAIDSDDLVSMRRDGDPEYQLELLGKLKTEIQAEEEKELPIGQLSIFDYA